MLLSCLLAFIFTFLTFILGFGTLHMISEERYTSFLGKSSSSQMMMSGFLIGTGLVFVIYFFIIFMKRMNGLTNYISEIAAYVDRIAQGNLKVNIPIKQQNELGQLAMQINEMACSLNEAREKEHEWEQQKYNLITNLSHDLKTPLTSIMGFLERIVGKRYEDEGQLMHYSQVAFQKSIQLKGAIDNLFELSKLNNSEFKLNKISFNLKELVEQVMMGFIPELEEKHIQYEIKMIDTMYEGDPALLVRVFENLIGNAIKHGIDVKQIIITLEREDQEINLHVMNDGKPILEEEREKIFHRFYRAEKNSNKTEGNGIGLAIVKTIIDLHGGQIEVRSDKKWTDFSIKLF